MSLLLTDRPDLVPYDIMITRRSPRLQSLMPLNVMCHCATRTKSKDFVKCETEELQIAFCLAIGEFVFHITEEGVCSPRQ